MGRYDPRTLIAAALICATACTPEPGDEGKSRAVDAVMDGGQVPGDGSVVPARDASREQAADAAPDAADAPSPADAAVSRPDLGLDHRGPPQTCTATRTPAPKLSQTGCFAGDNATPVASVLPFSVLAPLWSDAADKTRYLAIPENTVIGVDDDGDFVFPVGSVLIKTFTVLGRRVETRFLMEVAEDDWMGVTYLWNAAQTDAVLLEGAADVEVEGEGRAQRWSVPSREQCFLCHQEAAGYVLGLELGQLDFPMSYPTTGRTINQLTTLRGIGVLEPQREGVVARELVAPDDLRMPLPERARSYLYSNCSSCHRPGGSAFFAANFLTEASLTEVGCDVAPKAASFGLEDARIIAPSAPQQSVLLERMRHVAEQLPGDARSFRMPPLGVSVVDVSGLSVLEAWIAQMKSCEP